MTGSASQDGQQPVRANQQADGATGPTSSLIVAAVAHVGVFAWKLSDTGTLPALRLPFGNLIAVAGAAGLLMIFLIAAFGRRGSLSFVVVPAMIVAGVAAHAASAVLLPRQVQLQVLVGVLGFGALSVALTLSFGAAAIASRVAPSWSEAPFTRSQPFRLGAAALAAVFALTSSLGTTAPIVALCTVVGLIVLGAMLTSVERDPRGQGPAMAELVSSFALALAACWVATIVAGAASLARIPQQWESAQLAMRYAWLTAMPLVLAAVVGILPRVTATGLGVKRGLSTVLATVIGALTCAGLGQVVLVQSAPSLLRPSVLAASATPPRGPRAQQAPPQAASTEPATRATAPVLSATNVTAVASTPSSPMVAPAPVSATVEGTLFQETEQARLTLAVLVDGPMLLKDAQAGSQKTMKRLLKCYEKHGPRGEPTDLKLELSIDEVGSVKQVDVLEGKNPRDKFTTCIQMAFYRSGFSGGPKKSLVEVALSFAPKG